MKSMALLGVGGGKAVSVMPSASNPQTNSATSGATSISKTSYTPSAGSNRIVVAVVSLNADAGIPTGFSGTFGGNAMTLLDSQANGDSVVVMLYIKEANFPSVPATVTVNWTNSAGVVLGVYTILDADQTTPFGTVAKATGNSTAPSVAVTSEAGDLVVDAVAMVAFTTDTFNVGSGQTVIHSLHSGSGSSVRGASSYESGASSVTMSWLNTSSFTWSIMGVTVNPA